MRTLLTGNKGFVGSHVQRALEADGNEVVGLEASPTFREWYDEMNTVMDTPIDAVIHLGAISNNQYNKPDIFLWNTYATQRLTERIKARQTFVFFSSFLVGSTVHDWDERTPYAWSKAMSEDYIAKLTPYATILRPCVMWGNEHKKAGSNGSVPWRLASHSLEYLYRNWQRKYVHVSDVVEAVQLCLNNRPQGTFDLAPDRFWTNEALAELIEWKGYQ